MLTFAQYAQITDTGPAGEASATMSNRAVLYDQISNPGTNGGITAQDFEASFEIYSAEGADDFIVPAGDMWSVDNVQVLGSYSAAGPCNLANVRFYADNSGTIGALLFEYIGQPANPDATGNLDVDIPPTVLGAGTYWISVQGSMDYGVGGQWYWSRQAPPINGSNFMWQNPGNGFGSGYTTWVDGSAMWPAQTDYDLSFALNGGPVSSCTYQISLEDSYGDSWNGGVVTVFVDGTAVVTDATVASGYGPVTYDFSVTTGQSITTDYTAGSWSTENYYEILDPNGVMLWETGVGYTTPIDLVAPGITGNCPVIGSIEGFVYTTGGAPIQGALVEIQGEVGVPTDATGYYLLSDLQVETYEVWASFDGFSPQMASVDIVAGTTVQQDFYLGQPILTISPLIMENTLNPGEWFTDYISMLNTGDGDSFFTSSIAFTTGDGWLTLSDDAGQVAQGGGSFNLGVNFDAAGLAPGTVVDAIITLDFTPVSQVNIPVTMVVAGDPLPPVEEFHATLVDPVIGKVFCTWDYNPDVTFQYFEIRRDGAVLGITTELTYIDFLPDYGSYTYSVSAVYNEGMSTAQFDDVDWFIPVACWLPDAPEEDVMINQTEDTYMFIENCGQGTLSWGIPFAGNFQVVLYDSYGDGWNGGLLDVFVNGDMVLSNLTIASGYGPEYHSFPVVNGDEITTIYTPGSWTTENSYDILNDQGVVVYGAPNASIPPGVLFADVSSLGFITSIVPQTGTLDEGETQEVRFTYDATGYSVGTYTQDILLQTNEQVPNEHVITHTMNVYVPGMIEGNVTDCNTGMGLNNVTVSANNGTTTFYAETNANGYYELYADAGTYNMNFALLGYQIETATAVVVTTGNTTTQDASLCEEAYPVSGVFADPNEADTQCLVTWNLPAGPYTIIYDDGSAEDYAAWIAPGGGVAVKFSPAGYPASVIGGKVYVGEGFFPEGGSWLGTGIAIGVLDDDGTNGMPGTIIDSVGVTVNNYGWVSFGLSGSTITDGDFYLVMWQLGVAPDVAPIGIDTDQPTVYRSYAMQAGGDWFFSPYQDYMIRANVSGPTNSVSMNVTTDQRMIPQRVPGLNEQLVTTGAPVLTPGFVKTGTFEMDELATRDLNKYNVFRMFGFDPNVGEGPADGAPTGIGSTSGLSKNDTQFGTQPDGFYAYAVEAEYDSGDKSPWAYSNIVAHGLDNVVTVTVDQCDGGEPSDAEVYLVGRNYPYQSLFGATGADGIVVFDSVINGNYDITIIKVSYQTIFFVDVPIFNDYNIDVVLQENDYPARNLFVEPLTSVATWDEALIQVLQLEDFEGTFPPAGWTTFSDDPGSPAAWNKMNAYAGFFAVPPQFEDGTSSYFAGAMDDMDSGHQGENDLLITPMLDLRESDSFVL
ncbi:MAG: hypothetical protein DRP93_04015, partial [Candidatus Neomarinimicrobiota bacterium]